MRASNRLITFVGDTPAGVTASIALPTDLKSSPNTKSAYQALEVMATQISHNIRQSADVVEHSQSNVKAMFDALEKDENGEVTRVSPKGEKSTCKVDFVRLSRKGKLKLTTARCQYK